MYIGPDQVLLTLDVEFDPKASARSISNAVRSLEQEIRARFDRDHPHLSSRGRRCGDNLTTFATACARPGDRVTA